MQKKLQIATGLLIWLWCVTGVGSHLYADCQSYLTKTGVIGAARMGFSAAVIGDVNGDQVDDFIIGAPGVALATISRFGWADSSGHVYVYSGATGNMIRSHQGSTPWNPTRNDEFGYSVAAAGDVDNDGVPDYIVGSPMYYANYNYRGKLDIFSGSTGGEIDANGVVGQTGRFGERVASLGDINDDSRSEVLISAPQVATTGRVYVYGYGGADTLALIGTLTGPTGTSWFGFSVSAVDVNNDGKKDILVSTRNAYYPKVYIYDGSSRNLIDSIGGFAALSELRVCGLGDVNGDNYGDFVVGSKRVSSNGEVKLYSGQNRSLLHTYTGTVSTFGISVSTAGDFDNDNVPDVLIGQGSGSMYVYSCAANKSYSLLHTVSGSGDFGTAVAGPEGTDNDGYGLIIAGAPNSNTATIFSCGYPEVDFSGSPRVGIPPVTVNFQGVAITPDPITAWNWSFGDDSVASGQNPSHVYKDTGSYTVTLMATGFNGTDTVTHVDYVSFKSEYDCGDVNGDEIVDISDYVYLDNYIFGGGPAPIGNGDVNCDTMIDISDEVYIINYIFSGGAPPCDPDNDGIPEC